EDGDREPGGFARNVQRRLVEPRSGWGRGRGDLPRPRPRGRPRILRVEEFIQGVEAVTRPDRSRLLLGGPPLTIPASVRTPRPFRQFVARVLGQLVGHVYLARAGRKPRNRYRRPNGFNRVVILRTRNGGERPGWKCGSILITQPSSGVREQGAHFAWGRAGR